jgi:AcrR family transcriptional regulator
MPDAVKSHRNYDSPRRREQARATRRVIHEAARALFIERGYVATTMDAMAARAGVAPETVYAIFRTKRAVLSELVDISIAGGDSASPILEQPWVREITAELNPRRRLQVLARNGAAILRRRADLDDVVRGAAAADPDIAALWQRGKRERLAGQRELLRLVMDVPGPWALDLPTAADTMYAIGSPETYRLLVVDRGWTHSKFAEWYGETLMRLFIPAGQMRDGRSP